MIGDIFFKLLRKFNFIKKKKIYIFGKSIIIPFLTKSISRLYKDKIDDYLIIMGAHGGSAFLDNTKYLFKFLNKRSNYRVIWITKFFNIYNNLKKNGYEVLPFYSLRTIRQLRRARFIILTHGHIDIPFVKFSPKSTIILTWHGTPIKRINIDLKNTYYYKKWGDIFRLRLQFNQYIDHLLTPTGESYEHNILKKAFGITQKKILDIGYPRNDILLKKDEIFINNLKKFYNVPVNIKKIYLYAPTFRKNYVLRFPISKNELTILNNLLIESNSLFLIKAHIYEQIINFDEFENVRLVDKTTDIQELLVISDILITDYSSVIFDYLLTMKPILLFSYDLDIYKKERGMYYKFEQIAPGPLLFDGKDLINAIKNIEQIDIKFKEIRKNIRDRFNKYTDGKSIERLLNFLNIKYS